MAPELTLRGLNQPQSETLRKLSILGFGDPARMPMFLSGQLTVVTPEGLDQIQSSGQPP